MRMELAEFGLETASKLGASYADIRFLDGEQRLVSVKNGKPDHVSHTLESGYGVRLIVGTGWGFAGSYSVSKEGVEATVEKAVKIAKASSTVSKDPIELAPTKVVEDKYASDVKIDPFTVPLEETLDLLIAADKAYREMSPHVRTTTNRIHSRVQDKYIATSEGSRIDQKIVFCGAQGGGYVMVGGLVQRRNYEINPQTKGYEYIEEHDLVEMAGKAGGEAEMLLKAEPCPTEIRSSLILDDPHMYLQIHETIGHASELDRVLGTEVDLAGMSFLTPDKLGEFRYGSDQTNFVADPTIPHGLGTYGYDDEGVPANKVYLVKDGIFSGYQSSRETAAQLGLEGSSAGMRATTPSDLPLVRMNNICLEAGDWKSDEIVEDTKDGVLMRTTTMWSVDQRRLNFQFGCEIGWLIKNGEVTDVIRDPTYTGISYEFWRSLDATAKDDWTLYGTTGCGKGRPGQGIYVGHGAATTRISNVRIGITGRM
ncbi:MAG: TldD/PmbA family protein [Candidatus Bathyarchaeota archaeon]|nr:MAG: TldD/PmbA family protein [Candidatus Bathyarchaeota archaeon]